MEPSDVVNPDLLDHAGIRNWLMRALRGQEPLPRLSSDEAPYIAVVRRELTLKPATRDSLRKACIESIADLSRGDWQDVEFTEELLGLATLLKLPDVAAILGAFAKDMPASMPPQLRLSVLSTLVDLTPPQSEDFWVKMMRQAPELYAGFAFSGILAVNPIGAVDLLPEMPNSEPLGIGVSNKLELAWETFSPAQRLKLVEAVRQVLPRSGDSLRQPLETWIKTKERRLPLDSADLLVALTSLLGSEVTPRVRTPKILPQAA